MSLRHLFWLTILVHASFASMRVEVSLFALSLGASALTVGIIMALIAFLPMLISVQTGRTIDRIGPRRPMVLGTALIASGIALAVALPRLGTLFFVTPIAGVGFLLYHIAVHQAVGLLGADHERTRNFSTLALAFSTANFLGPMLAGFSIDLLGHRPTFALSALVGTAAWIVATRLRGDVRRPRSGTEPGRKPRALELLRAPQLGRVLMVSGILSMCWDVFAFAIPVHGVRIGLSASEIGSILGAFGVAIIFVRVALPLLAHRIEEWRMLLAIMTLTAIAFALIPLVASALLLMLMAFVSGLALGAAQPMVMTLIYRTSPQGRAGEAVGIRSLLLNISQTAVPLASGAFGAALGMAPAFWLMALMLAGGGWYVRQRA